MQIRHSIALAALSFGLGTTTPAHADTPAADHALEARLDRVLQQALDDHRIVGAVVIVARNGAIAYRKAVGLADREKQKPMRVDTIHRLASVTKPVVNVAVLRLVDQGRIKLDDPVTKWLPEFRPALADGTRPAITVRQLLTHTSGLGYRFAEPADGPYHKLGVSDGIDLSGISLDENLRRLGRAPLLSAPGAAWHYSLSIDVLGRVIEKVTREDLETAVRTLVTRPLAMTDTAFLARHPERLATPYADGKPEPVRMAALHHVSFGASTVDFSPGRATDPRAYASGGAGMVGTADDVLRLLETIRKGGAPLLDKATAELARGNAIGKLETLRGPGWGFGMLGAVLVDPAAAHEPAHAGSIDWGGVYGHSWWVDPTAGLSVVILTNTTVEGMVGKLPRDVKQAVYQSVK